MRLLQFALYALALGGFFACQTQTAEENTWVEEKPQKEIPSPQHTLTKDQTHNKFSSTIEPVLTVKSGAVIEAFTEDASDEQLTAGSDLEALANLTGPREFLVETVAVEAAHAHRFAVVGRIEVAE